MSEIFGEEIGVEERQPRTTKWQPTVDRIIERAKLLRQGEELQWGFPDDKTADRVHKNLGLRKHGLNATRSGSVLYVWKVRQGEANG